MCDNGESITIVQKKKIVTYRLKFIDSCRFMRDSLSNLVDNLSEINNNNNKEPDSARSMNASLAIDYYRFMQDSLSNLGSVTINLQIT